MLHKWDIMKVKRNQFYEHFKEKFEHRAKAKEWITYMILMRQIATFRDCFKEQKRLIEYELFKER